MLASGTLKNFMFLLKSFLFTDRAPVMKLICSTLRLLTFLFPSFMLIRAGGV